MRRIPVMPPMESTSTTFTGWPDVEAWTIWPLPMYIATWLTGLEGKDQVAGLQLGPGDRRAHRRLHPRRVRQADAGHGVGVLGQPRAVEGVRPARAPHVRVPGLGQGGVDGDLRGAAGRSGGRGGDRLAAVRGHDLLLRRRAGVVLR